MKIYFTQEQLMALDFAIKSAHERLNLLTAEINRQIQEQQLVDSHPAAELRDVSAER
jgi:hypothetical protein